VFCEVGTILFSRSKKAMFFKQRSANMDNSKNLVDRVKDGVRDLFIGVAISESF